MAGLFLSKAEIMMKKTSFLLSFMFIVICITACKDDSEPALPKEMVLSKVFRDGKLELEYRYNADKQLEQIREYDKSTGLLDYYNEFQYDTRGFLQNEITYNADEKPTSTKKYLKNNNGQFVSSEFIPLTGADSGKVTTRHEFEYNKEGYISKHSWIDPETDTEESFQSFYYYPNGNLEYYEYYLALEPSPEKVSEVRYSPASQLLPENIGKRGGYPINFDLLLLVAEEIKYKILDSAWGPASEYHELISDRVYNGQGLVIEQTMTYKYILPEKPEQIIYFTFEYMEI